MTELALWAPRAVAPEGVRERVRVRVADGRIAELRDAADPEPGDAAFADATLLPGLVDLQVNGAAGAAFDSPDRAERMRAVAYHVERGTTSLLATLVSAPLDALAAALERLAGDVELAGPVLGIHLEGPFLAAAKAGAHDPAHLVDPTPESVTRLLAAAGPQLRMCTLAPERPGALDAIARLVEAGAVAAAGHSVAGAEQVRRAVEAGLSFVTHVGNASDWPGRVFDPELGYRRSEPGLVGAFLYERRLRGSVILDGRHLHPELARALVELRGPQSVVLVSDATAAAGLGPGHYRIGGLIAEVDPAGHVTAGEGLAGSTVTLLDAVRVAVEAAGISLATAVKLAATTPARVIGVDERKGQLRAGADADLLAVGADWSVRAVYRAGRRVV